MTHSISASAHSFSLRAVSRRWTLGAALALTAAFGFAANAAHAEDLDDIKARGVITIGTEGVYAPYTYHDEKGRLTGYDVEVGRAIAKKLGVEAKFVETPWDALIAGIDAKRYDIGINQIGLSPERLAKYDFTKPYVSIKGVLLVRSDNEKIKGFEDLKGVRMAQTITSNWGKIAVNAGAEIVGVQDFAQSVQLIAQRRADAVVNSELAWVDYRKAQPNVPVKVVATTKEGIDVAIPVRFPSSSSALTCQRSNLCRRRTSRTSFSARTLDLNGQKSSQSPAPLPYH